jgi:hypothetical protein
MATLSDLVAALSHITCLPEASVFAYGRFAREGGLIEQRGRGRGAAVMELQDAANLLIAVGGTAVTREAADAIRKYRPMRGAIYDFAPPGLRDLFLTWIKPLGLKILDQHEFGTEYGLKAPLGEFVEFLITEGAFGGLVELMRRIPVGEVPFELWAEWKRTNSPYLYASFDLLHEKGLLQFKPTDQVKIGEDLEASITFVRTGPRVDFEIKRMITSPETVFQISFYPPKRRSRLENAALRITATLTHDALVGLGLVLTNQIAAKLLKSPRQLASIYERQSRGQLDGSATAAGSK